MEKNWIIAYAWRYVGHQWNYANEVSEYPPDRWLLRSIQTELVARDEAKERGDKTFFETEYVLLGGVEAHPDVAGALKELL